MSMRPHRFALLLALVGCVDAPDDTDLAADDAVALGGDGAADSPSWEVADSLHANTHFYDSANAHARRVHSLWVDGSPAKPVSITLRAAAGDGQNVRFAVLGPVVNGHRAVLAADGYNVAKRTASLTLPITTSGEHLVVVGSYNLATDTFYDLSASCDDCEASTDILATPKDFALAGDSHGLVQMQLGSVMQSFNSDVAVEVWASPPMQGDRATKVATSYASGSQVNVQLPASVKAGDDLRLVVRQGAGRVLDSGVAVRFMPGASNLVRLDSIMYGDIASMQISGVVGFYEGSADLRLWSETRKQEIAQDVQTIQHPGQTGMGFSAFDATFSPDLSVAARDGELLSVGFINGNGDYKRLGCFEYCNDLSGMGTCTGGPRACP